MKTYAKIEAMKYLDDVEDGNGNYFRPVDENGYMRVHRDEVRVNDYYKHQTYPLFPIVEEADFEAVTKCQHCKFYRFIPEAERILTTSKESEVVKRCSVCGWPLALKPEDGCVDGNCSYRPDEGSDEYLRIQKRRKELTSPETKPLKDGAGVVAKKAYEHPTDLASFEDVFKTEYQQELDSCDRWIKWCQENDDTHGMNFHQGMRSALVFNGQKTQQLINTLKQLDPNKSNKIVMTEAQLVEMLEAYATAIADESEHIIKTGNRSPNAVIINHPKQWLTNYRRENKL